MAFFTKFATGGLLAAGSVFFFRSEIDATAHSLTATLDDLTRQLQALAPAPTEPLGHFPRDVPDRLALSENLKASWNDKLLYGFHTLRSTNWVEATSNTWAEAKGVVSRLGPATPSGTEVVQEAQEAQKQV